MELPESVESVMTTLNNNGFQTNIVGGAVRNDLLHKEIKDYDVATSAKPDDVMRIFPASKLVGEKFGVVRVGDIEVATFRKEGEYTDHRRPDLVTFGTRDEDAKRRDFTINCMYLEQDGSIFDPFHGQEDLANKLIKCVGNPHERFNEDALRIMRAIRFAAQLGFSIDATTFDAMKAHAADLILIAQERIRDEFDKILVSNEPVRGIQYMLESGAMKFVIPELYELAELEHELHLTFALLQTVEPTIETRLAALLHSIGKPASLERNGAGKNQFVGHEITGCDMARERLLKLRYDRRTIGIVTTAIRLHTRLRFSTKEKNFRKLVYECRSINVVHTLLSLFRGGISTSNGLAFCSWCADKNLEHYLKPALPINGFDLERIGMKGAIIGYTIERIRERWFDNPELTEAQAMQIATSILLNPPKELK